MLKPPASTMPGMTDTLDFVKNLWGSMNIPGTGMPGMSGLVSPTLSTDDLDKRIADLKAVESWLNMNLAMLRGTIQAMEVQRGTLAALKSMGASMAEAMRQSGAGADKMAAMPFTSFFNPTAGTPGAATDAGSSQSAAAPSPAPGPAAAKPAAGGDTAQPGAAAPAGTEGAAGGGAAMGMPAAIAWWNLLQDQFQQAVASAMSSAAPSASPAASPSGAPASSSAPSAASKPSKPDAANAKAAAPAPASSPQANAPGSNGSGKPRTPRSRADKA